VISINYINTPNRKGRNIMHIKKLCLLILMLAAARNIHAQWQQGANNSIYFSNGNVGIGTNSPHGHLHVTTPGLTKALIETTADSYATLAFQSNGKLWEFSKRPSGEGDGFSLFYHDGVKWVYPNYLHVTTAGNVGIGTADPKGYKLAVNGNAIFEKVIVKQYQNWPDYVFHATYRLRPLSEVEQFIKQYQHLPGVPSAADVEKNGLNLGDNQASLLKKIEELTLYLIEQNKEIAKKDTEVADLKKQLQQISQRLDKLEKR
jgi:hypothetical protein